MTSDRQAYRYERQALLADYARAGGGTFMCAALAGLAGPGALVFWPLCGAGLVFVAFGLHVGIKHRSTILVSEDDIARVIEVPLPRGALAVLGQRHISWRELRGARLRFFGGRKARTGGIVEMRLRGPGATIRFDNGLECFDRIARHCAFKAQDNGVVLDAATESNLGQLGLR